MHHLGYRGPRTLRVGVLPPQRYALTFLELMLSFMPNFSPQGHTVWPPIPEIHAPTCRYSPLLNRFALIIFATHLGKRREWWTAASSRPRSERPTGSCWTCRWSSAQTRSPAGWTWPGRETRTSGERSEQLRCLQRLNVRFFKEGWTIKPLAVNWITQTLNRIDMAQKFAVVMSLP